jgi:hypothetical protein
VRLDSHQWVQAIGVHSDLHGRHGNNGWAKCNKRS